MGEAELLAVPHSVLMDWESHPQRAAVGLGLHASGTPQASAACRYSLPSQHASIPACVHSFIQPLIQQGLPSACLVLTGLVARDTERTPTQTLPQGSAQSDEGGRVET